LAWLTRDFDPQSEDINTALLDPTPNAQLLGLSMRAWMHAGLERYEEQIADLSKALLVAQSNPAMCDASATGLAIHSLLGIAYELGDSIAMQIGESAFESLDWTPDLQVDRFQCIRRLAWDAFLNGKSARAQWLFKDSKDLAPSNAWQVMAHVDRAYVARMNLNEIWATEELLQAHKVARGVAWSATRGEERLALVYLAILFAPTDMAQAQRYVSEFIQMGTENVNPTLAMTNDRRASGLEKYASGRVHQVLGHKELAIANLEAAYKIFFETRHYYRAAQAAMALSEITQSREWHRNAVNQAGHFPNSPIYERLGDTDGPVKESGGLQELTAMQRQIAHALCEGLDVTEMSRRFSRSTFTLSKQIELVYRTLGVSNRNELRAELQNRAG
jgi:DNA-binding CsgD family transcriptional regulator